MSYILFQGFNLIELVAALTQKQTVLNFNFPFDSGKNDLFFGEFYGLSLSDRKFISTMTNQIYAKSF